MSSPLQFSLAPPPVGYCSQAVDTSISDDIVRFHLYQQRTTAERLQLGAKFRQNARQLSFA